MRLTQRDRHQDAAVAAVTSPARDGEVATDTVLSARAGDAAAFTAVVRHYHPRLRALASRLLWDRAAVDDVLQNAYVKAFLALADFREDAALGTWLYQITYRACVDYHRREDRYRRLTRRWEHAGTDPGADPAAAATARADLTRALIALPFDQRAAVLLVDAEGLDYQTAASILGVASKTLSSRLSRARSALRAALTEGDTL
jgi:RNA polymerase sigma-70 factor (ECF subfamily)